MCGLFFRPLYEAAAPRTVICFLYPHQRGPVRIHGDSQRRRFLQKEFVIDIVKRSVCFFILALQSWNVSPKR